MLGASYAWELVLFFVQLVLGSMPQLMLRQQLGLVLIPQELLVAGTWCLSFSLEVGQS
jgi:hypothetical protein